MCCNLNFKKIKIKNDLLMYNKKNFKIKIERK